MTLVVRNKIQGLDVKSFSGAANIMIKEHCKEYVDGIERKQDCFCLQFPSGNKLYYAHKIYEYRYDTCYGINRSICRTSCKGTFK